MADTDPAPEIAAAPSPAAVAPPKRGTTRRNILIGTGAVGGLLLGYAVWPRKQRLNWVAGPDESRINGWLKIGTDGRVIVAVPQAEMGQGVYTALPQILADELGADWNTVGVEPAPLNPVYANRGMAADATKKMPALFRGIANWGIGEVMSRFEVQLTGGSSSVRAYEPTLRLAGAAAREMLCKAAARRWDADPEDLDTATGFVIYKANRIRFADIAGEAAQEDMPSEPTLRSPSKNRLMGKAVQRIDIPAKTNGSARFGSDVRLPGLVYAAVRSGPTGADRRQCRRRPRRSRCPRRRQGTDLGRRGRHQLVARQQRARCRRTAVCRTAQARRTVDGEGAARRPRYRGNRRRAG